MSEWKVGRSKLSCHSCQNEITPGSHFWSRLVENPETGEGQEALIRLDYCETHWPVEGEDKNQSLPACSNQTRFADHWHDSGGKSQKAATCPPGCGAQFGHRDGEAHQTEP